VVAVLTLGASAFAFPASASVSAGEPGMGLWRTVPGPAVPSSDSANLTALAMARPSLGWASGFTLSNSAQAFEPLLSAWNGHHWRTVRVSIGTAAGGRLDGLAAQSATDAWAVGSAYAGDGSTTGQPLTEHWDGRQWTRVPAPGVKGSPFSLLLGVAVHSADDAWAVGEAPTPSGTVSPIIERWDGRRWRLAPVPDVGPNVSLVGVTVAADGQAWAVGIPLKNSRRPLVLHWTGHAWALAPTPEASGDVMLDGVTAVSPDDVWAVGTMSVNGGAYRPYAMRWNGRRWATVSVPDRGPTSDDRQFQSVTSLGGGRLAAVGTDLGTTSGGALYGIWNGRAWSVSLGSLSSQSKDLNAVAYDGRHAVWAVGSAILSQETFAPVVMVNR
jgi:hypothetical protein